MIEILDLKTQYQAIRSEILEKVDEIFSACSFIQGPYVRDFESAFGKLHDDVHTVTCANGTVALALALEAAGVRRGDEVITTPFTFFATAETICQLGAKPVFADVDPETFNLDPKQIEARITPKTRAILPVHIFGNPCDMDQIVSIAEKHSLKVVEDCAQAHLARYKGKSVGSFGEAGTFSFYPSKNLGAFGDAGAVVSRSESVAQKMRQLADHGQSVKYRHDLLGYNYRMAAVQAGILSIKLKHLKKWTEARNQIAAWYREGLKTLGSRVVFQKTTPSSEHAYHLVSLLVDDRDQVAQSLRELGVGTAIHYPIPLHLQPALAFLENQKGDFPVTENLCARVLSLPAYPELSKDRVDEVCQKLIKVLRG